MFEGKVVCNDLNRRLDGKSKLMETGIYWIIDLCSLLESKLNNGTKHVAPWFNVPRQKIRNTRPKTSNKWDWVTRGKKYALKLMCNRREGIQIPDRTGRCHHKPTAELDKRRIRHHPSILPFFLHSFTLTSSC